MIAQHSSKSNEAYTPDYIVEASRATLGAIDLDPASCAEAQGVVKAGFWYGQEHDGLRRPWRTRCSIGASVGARVFLNPPGGKLDKVTLEPIKAGPGLSSAAVWWGKLIDEWQAGNVHSAIFVCFSMAVFRTTQEAECATPFAPYEFPFCVPRNRINYDKMVDGVRVPTKGAPADSAIVLLPPRSELIEVPCDEQSASTSATIDRFIAEFSKYGKVRI
jgi:hypothetical protein